MVLSVATKFQHPLSTGAKRTKNSPAMIDLSDDSPQDEDATRGRSSNMVRIVRDRKLSICCPLGDSDIMGERRGDDEKKSTYSASGEGVQPT